MNIHHKEHTMNAVHQLPRQVDFPATSEPSGFDLDAEIAAARAPAAAVIPPLGRGAAAAIASAVERVSDDFANRQRELHTEWEKIKGAGDALIAEFAAESEALIDKYGRRSAALQDQIEQFSRNARAVQEAVRAAPAAEDA